MRQLKYNRELYSKTALIKAAYNFTDRAYLHLDADKNYYYVSISTKDGQPEVTDQEFENEILAHSLHGASEAGADAVARWRHHRGGKNSKDPAKTNNNLTCDRKT